MKLINAPRAASILFDIVTSQRQPQGPVLVPANVCPIVPLTMIRAGREIQFVDIDERTLAMDATMLLEAVAAASPGCVVVYVHTYGAIANVNSLFAQLKQQYPEMLIVDDRCAARPEIRPDARDCHADATLYSTGYGKYVDLGWGGYAVVDERLALRRHQNPYSSGDLSKLTHAYQRLIRRQSDRGLGELLSLCREASWLDLSTPVVDPEAHLTQLGVELAEADAHKRAINAIYSALLPSRMQRSPRFHDWRFQVTVTDKHACLSRLFELGLFASDHYFPASRLLGRTPCPAAEAQHRNSMNLFNDFNITRDQARQVAEVVGDYAPES